MAKKTIAFVTHHETPRLARIMTQIETLVIRFNRENRELFDLESRLTDEKFMSRVRRRLTRVDQCIVLAQQDLTAYINHPLPECSNSIHEQHLLRVVSHASLALTNMKNTLVQNSETIRWQILLRKTKTLHNEAMRDSAKKHRISFSIAMGGLVLALIGAGWQIIIPLLSNGHESARYFYQHFGYF